MLVLASSAYNRVADVLLPQKKIRWKPDLGDVGSQVFYYLAVRLTREFGSHEGSALPERVECRYCGRVNDLADEQCKYCGAALFDAVHQVFCDHCGVPLRAGTSPAGKCVTCGTEVYLCAKHLRKAVMDEIYCEEHESECFIATAVIGTPLDPQIDLLRRFRNTRMLTNRVGRVLVRAYYELSPAIAHQARRRRELKEILRRLVVRPWLAFARILVYPHDGKTEHN